MVSADHFIEIGGQLAMIGWLMLIVGPRRWPLLFWIPQFIIPAILSLAYGGLVLTHFFEAEGGFGSLADIRALFQSDYVLAAGWLHYLAFDLFIGAWIARRSDEAGVPRLIQAALLAATFMFGPLGLVLFFLTRTFLFASARAVRIAP